MPQNDKTSPSAGELAAEKNSVSSRIREFDEGLEKNIRWSFDRSIETIAAIDGQHAWLSGGIEAEMVYHEEGPVVIELRIPGGYEITLPGADQKIPNIQLADLRTWNTPERASNRRISREPITINDVPYQLLADGSMAKVKLQIANQTIEQFTEGHTVVPLPTKFGDENALIAYDDAEHRIIFVSESSSTGEMGQGKITYAVMTPSDAPENGYGFALIAQDLSKEDLYERIKNSRIVERITEVAPPNPYE